MDFTTLKRKELQSLCKNHGIPANLSNAEMAKRLSSLLEVKEKKKTKSCFRSVNNEVDNVDEESKKVGKRVKFSPQNETFEFERTDPRACRLLARKRRSMAKPQTEADPGLVSDNVNNPVGNSRNSKRKAMVNSRIEGNNSADVGCVEEPVGRNLRRKSMAVSVCEGVSNVDMVEEKGNVGRNVRRSVVKVGEGLMSEDVGEVEKPAGGENVGRNLRRKSMAVSVSQVVINDEMLEQEGKPKRNVRSVVKVDKGLVSEDAGKVEKSIEGGNVVRNLRSRGKQKMKGKEELTLVSPCVERRARRGRKGSQVVNEGCIDGVDNNVSKVDETEKEVVVTRRRLRSREVRVENLSKGDDEFNEKSENVMPVPRRSSRQTNKGKSTDDSLVGEEWGKDVLNQDAVKNQQEDSVEVALKDGKRKRVGKKISSGKQQEVKDVFDEGVDKVNINDKKPEESNACGGRPRTGKKKAENDLQEGIEDAKVVDKKGQRRKNIIVEEDCGTKEMHAAKRSTRSARGLTQVDESLSGPVLDEIVPQSNEHLEEGEKETVEVVTSDGKPNGCGMENDDGRTDHTSVEEPTSGAAALDDSVSENKKSEVEVEIHETGSAISVEQKQAKCEVDMHVCVTRPLNVQRPEKNESPSPSILQGDCRSAVQNCNMEMPLKAHVVSSTSSQEDCECIVPVTNTEMFDGTVDMAEPDCGNFAKPTTPCSSRAVNINGESSTAAAVIIQKSDGQVMEQEGLSGSREISFNIFKESGGMTPEISSVRRAVQHFQDEKASSDANDKPSLASTGLASAFAASVAAEYDLEKEGVDNQSIIPKQNLEVGSSSKNHEEPKVVDSQSTDSSEGSPKPMIINISYLFSNDEQYNADEEKSEPDVAEPNCSIITNSTSPRSNKVDDIDRGIDNMENAEGRKIVDQDDQIVQEAAAFTRDVCDNLLTESECMATDNSDVQILDHYIPVEKVEMALDASVEENFQPSAILDGSTPVSPATLPAGHTLMEENVDTETTTPSQNLEGRSCCCNNQESGDAISGSISISSLFRQSPIKEQCQANDDYILTEKKEETSKENVQLSEESSRRLNLMFGTEKSEKLTESNNIVQMAPEDVETIAENPANNRNPVPFLLQNGSDDEARISMETSSGVKVSTQLDTAVGNNFGDEIVSTPLSISLVAPEHSRDRVSWVDASTPMCTRTAKSDILESRKVICDDGLSCQQFVSVEGAKSSCQRSNDQLSKLHLGLEGSIAQSGFASESKLQGGTSIFEKSGDQILIVVDQGKKPELKNGQVVGQGKEPEPKDDQVVDQGKEPEPKDGQVVDQGKEPEPKDGPVADQGIEPELKDDQVEDQEEEPEPKDDQVVDHKKEFRPKESCDITFKEAEHTTLEALNSDESIKIGEPSADTSAAASIVIGRLSPLSEVSLCKPAEKAVETNSVTPQQSWESEFRSINEEAHYMFASQTTEHTEDMLESFPMLDDELIVSQDSPKKGEQSERGITSDLSCFDNITKLDYFVEHDESLANQKPEDGQNFMDAKLRDTDLEDGISNSDSMVAEVTQENDKPAEYAVLLQDKKSAVVSYETNGFSFSPTLPSKTVDIQASALKSADVLNDGVIHADYSTISAQHKEGEPSKGCFLVDRTPSTTSSSKKDDSEGIFLLESTAFGAKDNIAGSYAADNAVECVFGSEHWLETWKNTSEDKGSDTPQRVSLADDKELCLTTSIHKEDNQDCEGDVKLMENVNSLFHESAMFAVAKPKTSTCDISLSASHKSLNTDSSPHCSGLLSKSRKAVDHDGIQGRCDGELLKTKDFIPPAIVQTQLLCDKVKETDKSQALLPDVPDTICLPTPQSSKLWIDHAGEKESEVSGSENAWKVVELSGVTNVDSEKFNNSGDEGDKFVGQPDMNEAQNQYQMYPEQKDAYDSGHEHVSSQTPGDGQGSPRGTDGMATTPEQNEDGLHGILEVEGNQDQENSTESCMFSKWELDFIYGEMAEEMNEFADSSEKSTSKNDNDNVNANPQENNQIKLLQLPGNFHEESPDRKHGKITVTGTDNAGHIDENKAVNPSSMIKRDVNRSILIHGTPKKSVLFTHDMKENAPSAKIAKMVDVTAVKPIVKRKALGDLGK